MNRAPVEETELNAYVDGELPADAAAMLAQRAAREPDLATRIARLHRLKAAVAGLAESDPPALPELSPIPTAPGRAPSRWRVSLAVAAALALVVGVAALLAPPRPTPQAELALHDAWADSGTDAQIAAPVWLTAVIEATGLRLARTAPLMSDGARSGTHYAFVGTNQCRLSLFELPPAAGLDSTLTLLVQGDLRSARWQAGGQSFLVIARNMDGARFATIAAALNEATISRAVPAADQIALLRAARQRCLS